MATIYLRYTKSGDPRYYASITLNGKRVRKLLGYSKRGAELRLRELEYEAIFHKTAEVQDPNTRLSEAILAFLKTLERSSVGKRQLETLKARLRRFDSFCNGEGLDLVKDIKPIHARGFLDSRRCYKSPTLQKPLSTATLNKELQALRRLFVFSCQMEWVDHNPFLYIKPLKQAPLAQRYYFSDKDLKYIFKRNAIYCDIYGILLYTGLRPTDGFNLGPEHINGRYLLLQVKKTLSWLNIPLSESALEILKPRMIGKYIFPELQDNKARIDVRKKMQQCFSKEFVRKNNINLHTFRHTYAHNMLNRGVPKEVLQTLLGHRSIKTTEIYANWVHSKELERWV